MGKKLKHPILVIVVLIVSLGIVHLLRTERNLFSILFAFELFGTLVHEIGHSVAAIISGGQVLGFVVNAGSGGYAMLAGGNPWLILPAGYVGSAIFGSLFFYLSNRYRWADFFAFAIGAFIIGFSVIYGKPEENGDATALYIAIVFGVILIFLGYKGPLWLNMLLVNIITTFTALQGALGAWSLYILSEDWHHNDAVMMAQIAPVFNGNTWALIWAIISVLLFTIAFYQGVVLTIHHNGKRWWDYRW